MLLEDKSLEGPYFVIFRGAGVPLPFLFPLPPQRVRVSHPSRTAIHETLEDNFLDDFSGRRSIVSQVTLEGTFGYHARLGGFGTRMYGGLHLLEFEKAYETYNALSRQTKKSLQASVQYICIPRLYLWRINIDDFSYNQSKEDPLLYYYTLRFRRLEDLLSPVRPNPGALLPAPAASALASLF